MITLLLKKIIKENYSPKQLKVVGIDSFFPHLMTRELSTMFISLEIGVAMKRAFIRFFTTPPKKQPTASSQRMDDTSIASTSAATKRAHVTAESATESDSDSEEAVFERYSKKKRSTRQDGTISQNISYKKKGRTYQFISTGEQCEFIVQVNVTRAEDIQGMKAKEHWKAAEFRALMAWTKKDRPLVEILRKRVLQAIDEVNAKADTVVKEYD